MKISEIATPAAMLGMCAMTLCGCAKKGPCKPMVEIAGDHPHAATVSADRVKRDLGGSYLVEGAAHKHVFRLKSEDRHTLLSGGSVTTRTSSSDGHLHEAVVRCER